jgi:hypothetical protein
MINTIYWYVSVPTSFLLAGVLPHPDDDCGLPDLYDYAIVDILRWCYGDCQQRLSFNVTITQYCVYNTKPAQITHLE